MAGPARAGWDRLRENEWKGVSSHLPRERYPCNFESLQLKWSQWRLGIRYFNPFPPLAPRVTRKILQSNFLCKPVSSWSHGLDTTPGWPAPGVPRYPGYHETPGPRGDRGKIFFGDGIFIFVTVFFLLVIMSTLAPYIYHPGNFN